MSPLRKAGLWLTFLLLFGCDGKPRDGQAPIRLGYFPNITHAQALVGRLDGTFQRACGGKVELRAFNAGPAAMEALLGGSIDLTYVGGSPALTAFVRSEGRVHVVAGAVTGGSVLVVRKELTRPEQLEGKRIATPQLGNSQDVALRHFLRQRGMKDGPLGSRHVQVLPLSNADALGQFKRGELDGAWVPEPWGARLVHEAGGHILIKEADLWPGGIFPATVLVATALALEERPEAVRCIVRAHLELTDRWRREPAQFALAANRSYGELTQHPLPAPVLEDAFSRLRPYTDPMADQLRTLAGQSRDLGYLPNAETAGLVRPVVP